MATAEAVLFKLAGRATPTIVLSLHLNLRLRWEQHLRFAGLRRAYVEERKSQHEKRYEFDPARHLVFHHTVIVPARQHEVLSGRAG